MEEGGDGFEIKEIIVKTDNIKLSELTKNIEWLQDGQVLHVTHAFEIVDLGGKKIAIDPVVEGKAAGDGKVKQLGFSEAFGSQKDSQANYISAIEADIDSPNASERDKTNFDKVAEGLGSQLDIILITHLDPDHVNLPLIIKMMDKNPNLEIHGPLGWQAFLTKSYSTPNVPDASKTEIPEHIWKRLHALSPQPAHPNVDPGLMEPYPSLKLDRVEYEGANKQNIITAIEVPHTGTPNKVEYNQGFILENEGNRILFVPDSSMSPEALEMVAREHEKSPLTRIVVSTAKYNPEPYGPIKDVAAADRVRTGVEEFIQHSAYLPIALYALTEGKVPIHINHGGFFDNTTTEKRYMAFRVPIQNSSEQSTAESWIDGFKAKYAAIKADMKDKIDGLQPYSSSFGKYGRSEVKNLIKDLPTRFKFSKELVEYIKGNPIPRQIFDDLDMAQANKILQ